MTTRTLQSELQKKGFVEEGQGAPEEGVKIKRNEKLSELELRELMGEFKPKFTRGKGGAFRQR